VNVDTITFPDLSKYEVLGSIFDTSDVEECYLKHQDAPTWVFRYLCDPNPGLEPLRRGLENSLSFGRRAGLLDKSSVGRLRTLDESRFLDTLAEIESMMLFDDAGLSPTPRPIGRAGKVGEFQSDSLDPPLFVEVKTVLDRRLDKPYRRVESKAFQYARRAANEFTSPRLVHIERIRNPRDFRGRAFASEIRRQVESQPNSDLIRFVYIDPSGLQISGRALRSQLESQQWQDLSNGGAANATRSLRRSSRRGNNSLTTVEVRY